MSRFECWSDDRPGIQVAFVEEPTPDKAAEEFFRTSLWREDPGVSVVVIVSTEDGEVFKYRVRSILMLESKLIEENHSAQI